MSDPITNAFLVDINARAPRVEAFWKDELLPRIEWHNEKCAYRHGAVRNVTSAEKGKVVEALNWHFGARCAWRTKQYRNAAGQMVYDLEFVHKAKVFPAPTKPWQWCGDAMLPEFVEWQKRESERRVQVHQFKPGDKVSFQARGSKKVGLVASVNEKTVSVIVAGEGNWRVSPNFLTKEA